jgi:5-methyltetrahydropteroyltriglutamate--homocysteine methyltransferase
MKTSRDRFITTHIGSLPRPPELLTLVQAKLTRQPYDERELAAEIEKAVDTIVKRQADIGIDVICDGEFSKPSFSTYILDRLSGIARTDESVEPYLKGSREERAFPEYYATGSPSYGKRIVCNGPISYRGHDSVKRDIEIFKAAFAKVNVLEGFLPAIAPSNLESTIRNDYYKTQDEYLFALADAMREEYRAIVDAGLVLQIDYPRLLTHYNVDTELSLDNYPKWAALRIDALNYALRDLPEQQIRFHTCYGIEFGPRTTDLELKNVVDIMLRVRAGAYSFEGANPRHEHEWRVWRDVKLPDDKILIPGVITNSTVLVEHPQLVCDRILKYADIVGQERVIVGADCGFDTFAGSVPVHPTIVWAKLEAMVAGAELATRQLTGLAA